MTAPPCYGAPCRICTPERPCAATARWLEADREALSKATGLDAIARRAYARHAQEPPRFVPMLPDGFGEYVEPKDIGE